MTIITENDVREAYAKLRELMSDTTPPDAKREEVEAQAELIYDFYRNNIDAYNKGKLTSSDMERYAVEALAEGHIEIFEKAADWCQLFCVKEQSDLGPWSQCLEWLYVTINFRCPNSIKLANRLAKSKHYIRKEEMQMRWDINDENDLGALLTNNLNHLNVAKDAIGSFRLLYPLILEVYNTKK